MLHKIKVSATHLFNNPNAVRTVLVLSALAVAILTGAAPHDVR
jgi:hypothetical protein